MELRTLRYFVAVLEAGSLSRAAATLYVAQPALTAQIKKLEGELAVRLFDRSHAGITPTEAGLRFYHDACRLLSDAAAMLSRAQRADAGVEGSVTVALPFLLASLLMGSFLMSLREAHPRIRVFVIDGLSLAVKKAMLDGRAEVGILVDPGDVGSLACMPLARDAMYLRGLDVDGRVSDMLVPEKLTGPDGRPGQRLSFREAAALPLILQSRRYSLRQVVDAAAADRHVSLNIVHEHDSERVIRSLHKAGAGFTFSPACSIERRSADEPGWICARVIEPDLVRSYHLAVQGGGRPMDEAARVVRDALQQHVVDTVASGRWRATLLIESAGHPASDAASEAASDATAGASRPAEQAIRGPGHQIF